MVFNNTNRKGRTPATPAADRLSESHKKEVSVRLKAVDRLIRDRNLDKAELELERVRGMDPRNGYVLALGERIEELRKTKDNPQSVELPKTGDEFPGGNGIGPEGEAGYLKVLHEEIHKIEERLEAEYRDKFVEEFKKSEQRIAEMLREERESREAETAALGEYFEKERLESEDRENFMKEIKRREQRVEEMLKQERERHVAETAALKLKFEKEREKLLKELKKGTKKQIDAEFKKTDDSYRKLLADKIGKTEEQTRVEISALHEKVIVELKEALIRESAGLSDEERKAIVAEIGKQTEDELQARFAEELAKAKVALASRRKELEEIGQRLQTDPEDESETDLRHVGAKIELQVRGLKTASEGLNRKPVQETREALNKHPMKTKQDDPKSMGESESKLPEIQKEGETDLAIKSKEQLAKERERMDKLWWQEFDDIRKGVDWKDRTQKKKK